MIFNHLCGVGFYLINLFIYFSFNNIITPARYIENIIFII